MRNPVYAIWLAENCGYCSPLGKALVAKYGSCEAVFREGGAATRLIDGHPVPRSFGKNCDLQKAEQILNVCRQKGIAVIGLDDEGFPERLSSIDDPPVVLYAKGDLSLLYDLDNTPALSVVGTRSMTVHGQKAAFDFAYSLAKGGMLIVSGMAEGIDSSAHKGALAAGGKTIAVFGCGVDVTYPKFNFYLHEQIEREGLTLSEYPPHTAGYGYHFPQRNRIIAALSGATFVVEAKTRSGSLITANLAVDQGRDVYVLMTDYNRMGATVLGRLINEGASAVSQPIEIFEDYMARFGSKLDRAALMNAMPPQIVIEDENVGRKKTPRRETVRRKVSEPVVKKETFILPEGLSENAKIVYNALNASDPAHIDDIVEKTGLEVRTVSAALLELELNGGVKALPGKHYLVS